MASSIWIQRLLKVPGAKKVKAYLLAQGHTEEEADAGGAAVSSLIIFLGIILFNTFIYGVIRGFFQDIWGYCVENPVEATGVAIFGSLMILALLFQLLKRSTDRKAEKNMQVRMDRHKIEEKREYLKRGAMGNFEEILRFYLGEKFPEIEVKSVHVVDMVPRVRFQVRRFNTESGGKVDKNYELFRDALFLDTLHILEVAFFLSDNIPAVVVDAMMNFISGKAKYYDGMVLSVKAQRDVFEHNQLKNVAPFKSLTSFD